MWAFRLQDVHKSTSTYKIKVHTKQVKENLIFFVYLEVILSFISAVNKYVQCSIKLV